MLALVAPASQIGVPEVLTAMQAAFPSADVQAEDTRVAILWPDFALSVFHADAAHVVQESAEMAKQFAAGHAQEATIATCQSRFEITSSADPSMDHFNDFVNCVGAIERLGTVFSLDLMVGFANI